MINEAMARFERLADCHKDVLIESAHQGDDVIWINMCNIYGFQREEAASLKHYVLSVPRGPIRHR
jgi:hypothetical protein